MERLKPLFTDKSPVQNPPKILEKIQWVRPELVCEVAFASGGSLIETSYKIENSIKIRLRRYPADFSNPLDNRLL